MYGDGNSEDEKKLFSMMEECIAVAGEKQLITCIEEDIASAKISKQNYAIRSSSTRNSKPYEKGKPFLSSTTSTSANDDSAYFDKFGNSRHNRKRSPSPTSSTPSSDDDDGGSSFSAMTQTIFRNRKQPPTPTNSATRERLRKSLETVTSDTAAHKRKQRKSPTNYTARKSNLNHGHKKTNSIKQVPATNTTSKKQETHSKPKERTIRRKRRIVQRSDDDDDVEETRTVQINQQHKRRIIQRSDDDDEDSDSFTPTNFVSQYSNGMSGIVARTSTSQQNESDVDNAEYGPKFELMSYAEFQEIWLTSMQNLGYTIEQIEKGSLIRSGNRKAMYGRLEHHAVMKIFQKTKLQHYEQFFDFGHGIGNACFQAAYTVGCNASGIEIDQRRNEIANHINMNFGEVLNQIERQKNKYYRRSTISFIEGSLTDKRYFGKLKAADVVLCNNAENCLKEANDFVAILFASMNPGSRLVTLYKLLKLGRDINEENNVRKRHGLQQSDSASFFRMEEFDLGTDATTWCRTKNTKAYLYTRLPQDSQNVAFLYCFEKDCPYRVSENKLAPIAVVVDDENGEKKFNDVCSYCLKQRNLGAVTRTRSARFLY